MRIIGGTHRGTTLADVGAGDAAAHLRPTSDRVRESLFNVLQGGRFGESIRGAKVLDLFAGTGALGLEALSRSAAHVTFIDNGKAAQTLIRANIQKLKRQSDTTLLTSDATQAPKTTAPAGLVFLDPPYGMQLGPKALAAAKSNGWIGSDTLIVWEENAAQIAPIGFTVLDARRYGQTWVTLMKARA